MSKSTNSIPVFVRVSGGKLARFEVATSECEAARLAVIHHLKSNGPAPESAILALLQGGRSA